MVDDAGHGLTVPILASKACQASGPSMSMANKPDAGPRIAAVPASGHSLHHLRTWSSVAGVVWYCFHLTKARFSGVTGMTLKPAWQ